MKVIAIIITVIGLLITGISGLGIVYSIHTGIDGIKNSETSGIGMFAQYMSYAQTLGYVNLFGTVIIFLGVILSVFAMFAERKQQVVS